MNLQAQLKSHIEKDTNSCLQFYQSDCGDNLLYQDIPKLKFGSENSTEISDNFQPQLP